MSRGEEEDRVSSDWSTLASRPTQKTSPPGISNEEELDQLISEIQDESLSPGQRIAAYLNAVARIK